MTILEKGKTAPAFSTANQNDETIKLSEFNGSKNVVLYFYPKDDTPGCTIEANQFTGLAEAFDKLDTVVFGVSKDTCQSHTDFINKFALKVDLLADTDGTLCENYGVWQEKEKNGVKKMAILRSTFIIDKKGQLADVMYGVNHEGHAQAILEKIQQL